MPSLFLDSAYLVFLTLGICVVLSTGEIDLSIFGILALGTTLSLWLASSFPVEERTLVLIVTTVAFSVLLSILNAVFVVFLKHNSLLVTVASFSSFYGLSLLVFDFAIGNPSPKEVPGQSMVEIFSVPPYLRELLHSQPFGVRLELIIILVTLVSLWLMLDKTKLGLAMKAIGQNTPSAIYSGVNLNSVRLASFLIAGVMYGIGSILLYARFPTVRPSELIGDAVVPITCAVISGAEIKGGRLPLLFTVFGVGTFLALQQTVMSINIFPAASYHAVFGLVLLLYIVIRYHSK